MKNHTSQSLPALGEVQAKNLKRRETYARNCDPAWQKISYAIPMKNFVFAGSLFVCATSSLADPPIVEKVTATKTGATWRFDVTLSHRDTGWDDYADGWRVLSLDGQELGLRVLHHPHVEEQPFTRSLGGVAISENTTTVMIEARDNVGGWSGEPTTVKLPK